MSADQERWIRAVLSNDEASSDEELLAYFVENGLAEVEARQWLRGEL